jgi:photosystem II stability/assembly factor-like uncharacterized protein
MRITFVLTSTLFLTAGVCGAQTWQLQQSGTTAGLRGIHAVDGSVVWASGTDGTVLRSVDGGRQWQRCATPPDGSKLDFRGIWAWDAQTALALSSGPGDLSRLYRTTDGCATWKLLFTNPDAGKKLPGFWDGLLFVDRQYGLIYGDPVVGDTRNQSGTQELILPLQETHDGGSTWTPGKTVQPLPGESAFAASNSAMTTNQGRIWLGTSKARVLRRGRAGDWQAADTPLASGNDSSGVFSVAFRDLQHGVAVGGDYARPKVTAGTAAFTSDGGEHWRAASTAPHGYRSAVVWDAQDRAWITAGSNGSDISYDDGKTWQWLDSGTWNALSLPFAVGPHGQIGKLGTVPAHPAARAGVSR